MGRIRGVVGSFAAVSDSAIADRILAAVEGGKRIAPLTDADPTLDVAGAYDVLGELFARRRAQGWRSVGRKIGFTNRTIWPRYGVYRPMWSYVWDTMLCVAHGDHAVLALGTLPEPRIEPEVVFGIGAPLPAGSGAEAILGAVEWIAAGFEIVVSIFPDWRFRAPDCTAAFGLHGALVVGTRVPLAGMNLTDLAATLASFTLTLRHGATVVDRGVGANVLDSPAHALIHLRDVLAAQPQFPPLAPGEFVTTGTLTDAWPVAPGQRWSSDYGALPVHGLTVEFA